MNEISLWYNALIFTFCRHTSDEKERCEFELKRIKKEKKSAVVNHSADPNSQNGSKPLKNGIIPFYPLSCSFILISKVLSLESWSKFCTNLEIRRH